MIRAMGLSPTPHPEAPSPTHAEPWWAADFSRAEWLRGFRSRVASHTRDLARLTHEEVGKPLDEAVAADVMALLAAIKWHQKHAARILRPQRSSGRPAWMLGVKQSTHRAQLGRVGIIATWNYPVQLLGVQLVQALAAGNRVIVKPSEHAPQTQALLLELAAEGLPAGTLEWTEATREAGRTMITDGGLDHVVFTGSTSVGHAIAATLADRLIPSTLELSGRDSAIVLGDADPALAAKTIWHHVAMNAGQTCMAPRRALVHESVYAEFIRQLGLIASGEAPRRMISREAANEAHSAAIEGVEAGGRAISGVLEGPSGDDGRTYRPVAIVDCPPDAPTVAGNHFGPVIAVVPVASTDDALSIHHAHDQHLATSVYTAKPARARALAPYLGSSIVTINDTIIPSGHPAATLGGCARSGWGVSRGVDGLLAMTRPVAVSTTSPRLRLPVGPTPPGMDTRLVQLINTLYGRVSPARTNPAQREATTPRTNQPAAAATRDTQELADP